MSRSTDITDFASRWTNENVNASIYNPGEEVIGAATLDFVEAASDEGYSPQDLIEQLGDLRGFMGQAFKEATDNEVERRASKDD